MSLAILAIAGVSTGGLILAADGDLIARAGLLVAAAGAGYLAAHSAGLVK